MIDVLLPCRLRPRMKVATFNANGIRARLPVVRKWLENEAPDVLCLQETKVQDTEFPRNPIEALGYQCSFRGQKGFNGVAVLSRSMPERVSFGFGDGDAVEEVRLACVTVSGIHIVNTYVPQGYAPDSEKFEYKLSWLQRLGAFFSSNYSPDDFVLWAGDFNVAPEPIDVYDPQRLLGSVGFHPEEHKTLAMVKEWGFVDVFRKHEPGAKMHTFWDYRIPRAFERGLGWRLDHLWASPPLAERSRKAWIDVAPRRWERPSDHTFVVAEFDLA